MMVGSLDFSKSNLGDSKLETSNDLKGAPEENVLMKKSAMAVIKPHKPVELDTEFKFEKF
jgi:hypothetical protein